jgi:endonuclease YncB( thermonuclease family)
MNRPARRIAASILALFLLYALAGTAGERVLATYTAPVVHIADGDTITVLHDRQRVRIRFWGIDAPEMAQAWGPEAKQFTAARVEGQTVTLQVHDTDRYGRTVAEVILPDGRSLNRELVRAGLAWWYRHYAPADHELAELG